MATNKVRCLTRRDGYTNLQPSQFNSLLSTEGSQLQRATRSSYRSSRNSPLSVKNIVNDSTTGHIQMFTAGKLVQEIFKPDSKDQRRSFQVRLMKYDPPSIRKEITYIQKVLEGSSEDKFLDLFFYYRNSYVKDDKQLHLQLSMLSMRLHIFSRMHRFKTERLLIKPEEYLMNSLRFGSAFTEFMKKLRAYATLSTISHTHFLDLDEKIQELNRNIFNIRLDKEDKWSYDDFLSEGYLLFFEEDVNDYEWAFKPIHAEQSAKDMFRAMIKKVLLENKVELLRDPSNDDIMTWTSDSSSFSSEDPESRAEPHRTKVRNNARKKDTDPFGRLRDNLSFTRTIIPVGPGNFRDAWMPDLDSLFTIKSISFYMRQIIQSIPYSAMYDENIAFHRKSFLRDEESRSLYLLLDFKKSGITFNRDLLEIMGEELCEVYPGIKALEHIKSFLNLKVWNGKSYDTPIRGTGLGNMNELYTLFQCATGEATKLRYGTKSIFFNDDAAIQLHPKKWREQLGWTMGYLTGLGLIVNLAKTVVSHSNIFCEEYVIHGDESYDYNKHQLLIMPFADVMLQPTTAAAKRYFYSIDRQLLGTGYRYLSDQFLSIAQLIYENEFGKLDPYLPYHLGGWIDFSPTNFSCLFEYMLDPKTYISAYQDEGHIPEIRRWVQYNRDRLRNGEGLLSTTAKISYRDFVKNSLQSEIVHECESELSKFIFGYTGLGSTKEYKKMLDGIINFRGLHNAKPKIKFGLTLKEKKRRKDFYSSFKDAKSTIRPYPPRSLIDFKLLLQDIKEMDESPAYLAFPRFLIETDGKPPNESKSHSLVINKKEDSAGRPLPLLTRRVIANTVASVDNGYWIENSDPFILGDLWRNCKSGYLVSDKGIRYFRGGVFNVPYLYECFCPNKKLFIAEIQTRTGRMPLTYAPIEPDHRDFAMVTYKDALELILPVDLIGEWRQIKVLYRKNMYDLRVLISMQTLRGRDELKAGLRAIQMIYKDTLENSDEDEFHLPHGYDHFFEKVDQNIYLDRLIGSKRTVEELLEEEDSDLFIDTDYGSDEYDSEVEYEIQVSEDEAGFHYKPDQEEESSDLYSDSDFEGLDTDSNKSESIQESSNDIESEEDDNVSDSNRTETDENSQEDSEEELPQYDEAQDLFEHRLRFERAGQENDPTLIIGPMTKVKFNRFGMGIGAGSTHLRLNIHTFEIWDVRNAHDKAEYCRWRQRNSYLETDLGDYIEVDCTLGLNEVRRLLRHEGAARIH